MNNTDLISQREFARRLNVGEKTIRDGVRLGKIVEGITKINGALKINYPIAYDEALRFNLGHNSRVNKILSGTLNAIQKLDKATGKTMLMLNNIVPPSGSKAIDSINKTKSNNSNLK